MPLPKDPFKVFISHATHEDGDLAFWIAEALDRLHIRAFVYERYPRGGQNRFERIKGAINVCPYFLALLTKDGIASQWVNQEIGYAVGIGKAPIPVVEVDDVTGRRIESKGFVELHDPIDYRRDDPVRLMHYIIYTFYGYLNEKKEWQDLIFLSCQCGNEFEGQLEYEKWLAKWGRNSQPFSVWWTCDKCGRKVTISFPDCHLIPQNQI